MRLALSTRILLCGIFYAPHRNVHLFVDTVVSVFSSILVVMALSASSRCQSTHCTLAKVSQIGALASQGFSSDFQQDDSCSLTVRLKPIDKKPGRQPGTLSHRRQPDTLSHRRQPGTLSHRRQPDTLSHRRQPDTPVSYTHLTLPTTILV